MQVATQWVLLAITVIGFFSGVYKDFNGIQAAKPSGFTGFIGRA